MHETTTFGQWVKQRRKALNITQAELGRLVACSKVMIVKIEADQRLPSIQIARLLARYLKISPQDRLTFIRLARPKLSPAQVDEITGPYIQSINSGPARRRMTNLPAPLTPLIGRIEEVAATCNLLLDPNVRLVTLTGIGGIGKTRLSLQVAAQLKEQFSDGCWFISLAALREPELLIPTIARSLGIKETRDGALDEALANYLADGNILLVLDNFEQIIPAAEKLSEILRSASGVKVLVTSRTVLHISGEHEFVVQPLKFVNSLNSLPDEELVDSPAVTLFVQRAKAINTGFALSPENAATVAKICARLDGLPLAIELAASRIKFLSPAALLARLEGASEDGQLNTLAGYARDMPARQQTMRRTIDWSYNLLSKSERDLFRQLAVFVGGCTLEAAAAVCIETTNEVVRFPLPPHSLNMVMDKLASLVDQNMLQLIPTPNGTPRFRMLELLREYALERLATQSDEWTTIRRRHALYFMALAEDAEPGFEGPQQETWLEQLETEHDNLLAALAWSCSSAEEAEVGLHLAGAVWQFWLIRGYVNEGRVWLSRVLEQAKSAPELARARALNGAGFLNWAWSDFQQANILLHESLAIFRELHDQYGTAWALNHLAHVALAQNELPLAFDLVSESLVIFRKLGADWNIAWDLLNLGDIVRAQGDEAQSVQHYKESLDLFRKVGDRRGAAWALDHIGRLEQEHKDYAQAMTLLGAGFLNWTWSDIQQANTLLHESLAIFRDLHDQYGTAWVLNHLGYVALAQNDLPLAYGLVSESLAIFRKLGADWNIAWDLLNLGDIVQAMGDETQSVQHYEESLDLFRKVGDQRGAAWTLDHMGRLAQERKDYTQAMNLLEESLGLFRTLGDEWSATWILNHLGDVARAQNDF